jgi:hypothetical protein
MLGGTEAVKKVFIGWLSLIAFQQVIQSSIPKTQGQTNIKQKLRKMEGLGRRSTMHLGTKCENVNICLLLLFTSSIAS